MWDSRKILTRIRLSMGKGFYVTVIIHEATDFARFDENKETSSRFPPLSRDEGYT